MTDSNVNPPKHEEAAGRAQEFKLHSIPLSEEDMIKIPSTAMAKIWKNGGIKYNNEASLQVFVSDVLMERRGGHV
jgi:hypothetical protein